MRRRRRVYEFYAFLTDFKPKIWRRFQIFSNYTLAEFSYVLMYLFCMEAKPKFSIELTTKDEYECFELPSPLTPSMLVFGVPLDARETKLWNVIKNPGDRLDLFYDQGVPWHVRTAVKKIFTVDNLKKRDLPRVLEGEGYGIVKGCGGVAGLKKVVEAFKTKKGKLYEHYRKQLNEDDFDITSFNIEEMNQVIFYSPLVYKIFYEPDLFD